MNKNFPQIFFISISVVLLLFFGCEKSGTGADPENPNGTHGLEAPGGFDYQTAREVRVRFEARTPSGTPLKGIVCNVYQYGYDENNTLGTPLARGLTNSAGIFETVLNLPANIDSLFMEVQYIGMLNRGMVAIVNNEARFILGQGSPGGISYGSRLPKQGYSVASSPTWAFMGTWNVHGVPDYLEPEDDVIEDILLEALNQALPERQSVPDHNPEYLAQGNETNVVLKDSADIWITMLHDGAGYKNVLGYYTYPLGSPPQSESDIDSIVIIFPNASIGNNFLQPGNKVHLGKFPPNTVIGWALIANGWNGKSKNVSKGRWTLYSDPEPNPDGNQHLVFLKHLPTSKYIIGFEDIKRNIGSSDHDFNDVVFYITTSPGSALDDGNVVIANPGGDCDGDGVTDASDEYVCDPERALDTYNPGANAFATLAFEDDWPMQGDYDFNDLVVDWKFKNTLNADNEVVDMVGTFILRAAGSSNQNGFGFHLPVSPSTIASATGSQLSGNYITLSGNGTEAGQSESVIIVFDNALNVMAPPEAGNLVNTQEGIPFVTPDTITITIHFASPQSTANLGSAPYNPFIIVNGDRGKEVHLINQPPTDLVNPALFGTGNDASVPGTGEYYHTSGNLPWALGFPVSWSYPFEAIDVAEAYNYFSSWLTSGGSTNADWYLPLNGYRNEPKIYRPYGIAKRK